MKWRNCNSNPDDSNEDRIKQASAPDTYVKGLHNLQDEFATLENGRAAEARTTYLISCLIKESNRNTSKLSVD